MSAEDILTRLLTLVPGLPAVDKIEPGALDVLHAHDAVVQTRRGLLGEPFDNLIATGMIVVHYHDALHKPVTQLLPIARIKLFCGGRFRGQGLLEGSVGLLLLGQIVGPLQKFLALLQFTALQFGPERVAISPELAPCLGLIVGDPGPEQHSPQTLLQGLRVGRDTHTQGLLLKGLLRGAPFGLE